MREQIEFNLEIPNIFNFAYDIIDEKADSERNRLAILWVDEEGSERRITYWDLFVESNRVANFLKSQGIKKGDRVMLMLPRVPEWWFCILGLMKVGAVSSPSAISLTPKDLKYRCESGNIKMVITDSANQNKFQAIQDEIPNVRGFVSLDDCQDDQWLNYRDLVGKQSGNLEEKVETLASDEMLIYFTSGTTGNPKMVAHPHSYSLAHKATAHYWYCLNSNDIQWTITDTGWAKAAWGALFSQWVTGATVFLYEYKGRFDGETILNLIERYGITVFCAPPTAYRMLIHEDFSKYDFSNLRRCLSAGEPLNPEVIDAWHRETQLGIYEGYGQTESICLIATAEDMEIKPGAIGKPLPIFDIDVINDDLEPCSVGDEGHVAVKVKPVHPAGLFTGYLGESNTNEKCFVGDWYLTGDKAYKDEEGYFWFVGRSDDVIKSSGYRIGPFEVESALLEHPAVVESAVIGVPDEVKGQALKAYIILKEGVEACETLAEELKKHVVGITAPFKKPKYIEFIKELPKTVSGKIRRVELREREKNLKDNKAPR